MTNLFHVSPVLCWYAILGLFLLTYESIWWSELKASKASIFLGSIIPLDLLSWRVLLVGMNKHTFQGMLASFGWMRLMSRQGYVRHTMT